MHLHCFGSFCQDSMSKYGGFQCTMIALFALAFACDLPCNEWNTNTMNCVLNEGNSLYTAFIDDYMNGVPQFLGHDQLHILHHVDVEDTVLKLTIHSDLFYGTIGMNPDIESLASTFDSALETAFQISNSVLITANEVTVAVVAQEEQYFLFDSHARDEFGQASPIGTSVLLHFDSLKDLLDYVVKTYRAQAFNVSPVQFAAEASQLNQRNENDTLNVEPTDSDKDAQNFMNVSQEVTTCSSIHKEYNNNVLDQANENTHELMNVCNDTSCLKNAMTITSIENVCDSMDVSGSVGFQASIQTQSPESENDLGHSNATQSYYGLYLSAVITIACDNFRNAINPFLDHSYHNGHYDFMSVMHDHGYCGNRANSDFCGKHYLPYENYLQKSMDQSCCVSHRLLFKEKAVFKKLNNTAQCFCHTCKNKIDNGETPSITWSNNMDPGEIPSVIKQLTKIERRFISLIHVFMTVFLLPQKQQLATKGIAINIPASPSDLFSSVGLLPGVFVSFESRTGTDHDLSHFISTR